MSLCFSDKNIPLGSPRVPRAPLGCTQVEPGKSGPFIEKHRHWFFYTKPYRNKTKGTRPRTFPRFPHDFPRFSCNCAPQIGIVLIGWTWMDKDMLYLISSPENVILKIQEISSCDSPAKQHSRFDLYQGGSGLSSFSFSPDYLNAALLAALKTDLLV